MTERQSENEYLRSKITVRTLAVLLMITAIVLPVAPALTPDTKTEPKGPSGLIEVMGNPDHRRFLLWARLHRSEVNPDGFILGPSATPSCPPDATSYKIGGPEAIKEIFADSSLEMVIGTPFTTHLNSNLPDGVHSVPVSISCMNGENLVESSTWDLFFNLKG